MNFVRNICLFLIIGLITNTGCYLLKSDYLINFLEANLVVIVLTLMAINTSTSSLIVAKVSELTKEYKLKEKGISFEGTYKELKISLIEQIILVFAAIICLVFKNSILIQYFDKTIFNFVVDTVIYSIFIYDIYILKDTGVAIFSIFKAVDNVND